MLAHLFRKASSAVAAIAAYLLNSQLWRKHILFILDPSGGLGAHLWIPSHFKHKQFPHGACCWERHISFTKVTVLYIKHEIGPKARKYFCSFATQSATLWLLRLSCTVSTFFSSFIAGKTLTSHGYHWKSKYIYSPFIDDVYFHKNFAATEERHSGHFKRKWIKCDTECCFALVFKHRIWVGVLTWEPVRLNNLQYFMYNSNNITDFELLSQNPSFFLLI